jgi:hypothetical protein
VRILDSDKIYIPRLDFNYMTSIDDSVKGCERWKKAEGDLKTFNELMKVIKQYPIKSSKSAAVSPPYNPDTSTFTYSLTY